MSRYLGRALTRKQAAIFEKLIDDGINLHDVSGELGMSESTCSTHVERARRKLGAKTTLQAAVLFDRTRRPQ